MKRAYIISVVLSAVMLFSSCSLKGKDDSATPGNTTDTSVKSEESKAYTSSAIYYDKPRFLEEGDQSLLCSYTIEENTGDHKVLKSNDGAFEIVLDYTYSDRVFTFEITYKNLTDYDVWCEWYFEPAMYINCDTRFNYVSSLLSHEQQIKAHDSFTENTKLSIDTYLDMDYADKDGNLYNTWNDNGDNKVMIYYLVPMDITLERNVKSPYYRYETPEFCTTFYMDSGANIISQSEDVN